VSFFEIGSYCGPQDLDTARFGRIGGVEENVAVVIGSEAFGCVYARELFGVSLSCEESGLKLFKNNALPGTDFIFLFQLDSVFRESSVCRSV